LYDSKKRGCGMDRIMYNKIEKYMYECMQDTAHDPEHIFRVLYQSLNIASKRNEKINFDVLIASCLLHDIGREKQFKNKKICHAQIGGIMAKEFLLKNNWSEDTAEHINRCISSHRFRGDNIPETIEAKILFDSDKLDAIGCLGIARTLMYKGIVRENIYTVKNGEICNGENKNDEESFFKEYNIKLKNLYDKFYTEEAKEIANKYKEYARLFYKKLREQIDEAYKLREILNEIIND
jgi:uncharacterized protein